MKQNQRNNYKRKAKARKKMQRAIPKGRKPASGKELERIKAAANGEKIYDFYFSAKHRSGMRQYAKHNPKEKYTPTYFKGQEFTEAIEHGRTPVTNWEGDLICLGTGTFGNDVSWDSPVLVLISDKPKVFTKKRA